MKNLFTLLAIAFLALMAGCKEYDDSEIRADIEDLQERVTTLERLCREMNSNIDAMQTIVSALQNNDYITGVAPISEGGVVVGYTITFAKSEPITIYHGKDGKDGADGENGKDGENGQDGKDGQDGYTPEIGVAKDSDGIYYWTLDGEWLTDESGNKIKAEGTDGKNGEDGKDGENGQNGADGEDGKDGITPLLKIENGYWYVSYNDGQSWTQLGKATGEDGKDGENGANGEDGKDGENGQDGKDGDSFFSDVDYSNEEYVVFTLSNGTTIQVPTWYAFEQLRTLCNQMNSNIEALQAIVSALQNNDYVTSVVPVTEAGKTIGYTIYFSKSNPVTIYHGQDGKDGQNGADGADGKDGYTPEIGVAKDGDGIYYWTLDGEWLTDESGNKIKAEGTDGKNGEDGKDGENGAPGENGADGKDGITPLLKIENGYWYVSYNDGQSWTQLGKATGEDGKDGEDGENGQDGKDGDSFFQSVTQDEQYVYFTLADGTVITLPKGAALDVTFDANDYVVVSPNSTCEIGYTVVSVTDRVTVEVTSSSDIRAKVVADDATGKTGVIKVATGSVVDEYSKVILFVSNGEKVVMKSISFEQSGLKISNGATHTVAAEGGTVSLTFATNMGYEVVVPASATWIQRVPQTRAMVEYTEVLTVAPNCTLYPRKAVVKIVSSDGKLSVDYNIEQALFEEVSVSTPLSGGWSSGDMISLFAGNTKNRKFAYAGESGSSVGTFESAATSTGTPTQVSAHYALYPYQSSNALSAAGKLTVTLPSEQNYVAGGWSKGYEVLVGKSSGVEDLSIEMSPLCAYLCVKLWGSEQVVKSVSVTSAAGEALAGRAEVSLDGATTCTLSGTLTEVKLKCAEEVTLGSSAETATEFWFVMPPVSLSSGLTLTVVDFYGGRQTIAVSGAQNFESGKRYSVVAEVNVEGDGTGMGIGGWGDGGSDSGTAE